MAKGTQEIGHPSAPFESSGDSSSFNTAPTPFQVFDALKNALSHDSPHAVNSVVSEAHKKGYSQRELRVLRFFAMPLGLSVAESGIDQDAA